MGLIERKKPEVYCTLSFIFHFIAKGALKECQIKLILHGKLNPTKSLTIRDYWYIYPLTKYYSYNSQVYSFISNFAPQ